MKKFSKKNKKFFKKVLTEKNIYIIVILSVENTTETTDKKIKKILKKHLTEFF